MTLNNLGGYLRGRFTKFGVNADLEEAISLHREALNLRPAGHPDRPISLNHLAGCLTIRFEKPDMPTDLDEIITFHRAILDHHPPDHDSHAEAIDKLLFHLLRRVQSSAMAADVDEYITLGCVALALHEPGYPGHTEYLHHLVTDLHTRLHQLESASNIQGPSHHVTFLHDLIICVENVVGQGHACTDGDDIAIVARAVLRLCPPEHSDRILFLTTLATFLGHRFQ